MGVHMKVNQRTLLTCAVGSVLGISANAALAQESTGRSMSILEEVVVTAQKRSEGVEVRAARHGECLQ